MKNRRCAPPLFALLLLVAGALAGADGAAGKPEPQRFSVRLADSVLARWPDPTTISGKGWEYTDGIVLRGVGEVYRRTGDPRYLAYIKRWVDSFLEEGGGINLGGDSNNLDRVQPGVLLLLLYEETREPRYKLAADWLRRRLEAFPRNAEGGFWHKQKYPNEMWLDGIYMAEPFLVEYGRLWGDCDSCYDTAVQQATLVAEHTRDASTGLLRHAWDQDRNAAWADPRSGVSPQVWGRAMGWYAMALIDILEALPPSHPGRARLQSLLRETARGIRATQDRRTGLWYQVLDQGDRSDNWLETSASGMFVYALKAGVDRGHLDKSFLEVARRGWQGVLSRVSEDAVGRPVVDGAVEGMGVQASLAGYLGKKRLSDSPHGLCAVLLAASRMEGPGR